MMDEHPLSQGMATSTPGWSSLAGLVEDVLASAPSESPGCFGHALRVGSTLPAELAEWLYFEDRGGCESRPIDFIIGVGEAGRRILAGRNPALSISELCARDPVWTGIAALARRWSTPSDPLSAIERIWLEFDAGAPGRIPARPSAPGVFIDLPWSRQPAEFAPATLSALERVLGRAFPAETRRDFLELARRLPEDVSLPYAGVFPSRDPDTLRVCLAGTRPDRLRHLLPRLGRLPGLVDLTKDLDRRWPGRAAAAAATIHVDLGASVASAIGLEYAFDRRAQWRGRIAEWRFLEELADMGLLSHDSLDRCARWPASRRASLRHRLSPSAVLRRLAHVKIVWRSCNRPEAKLYLAAWHTPLVQNPASIH
jgi:hypothetical protein